MKSRIVIQLLLCINTAAWCQSPVPVEIPVDVENTIRERVEYDILYYRAKLSPEYDYDNLAPVRANNGQVSHFKNIRELLFADRGVNVPDDYKMVLNVSRWPEDQPYFNYYLVTKKGMRFSNGSQSVDVDVFNKYFDSFDERYLVYFKPDSLQQSTGIYRNLSGAFFIDPIYSGWFDNSLNSVFLKLIHARLARFDGKIETLFPTDRLADTPEYRQFRIAQSLVTPKALLARVIKPYPYNVIELRYYTNDTTITKGDVNQVYEVKYTISTEITTYEQTLPKLTLLGNNWAFIDEKAGNEDKRWYDFIKSIDVKPSIENKDIRINDRITDVKITEQGIIISLKKGKEMILPNQENTRYTLRDKSRRKVIITEKGEIVNE